MLEKFKIKIKPSNISKKWRKEWRRLLQDSAYFNVDAQILLNAWRLLEEILYMKRMIRLTFGFEAKI